MLAQTSKQNRRGPALFPRDISHIDSLSPSFARTSDLSPRCHAAVSANRLSRNEGRLFADQIEHRIGNILRHAPALRGNEFEIAVLGFLRIMLMPLDRNPAGRNDIDSDPPGRQLA